MVNKKLLFLGDTTQDLPSNELLNDINTYSGHNIVYAGKYIGKSISYDDINYKTRNEFLANVSYHYLRDFPEYRNWANLVDENPQGFSVGEIIVTNQGENYTTINRYKNTDGDMRGTLTLPSNHNTLTDEWSNTYSRPASAEWIADQDGKIIEVEILDSGNGYNTFTLDDDDMVKIGNFSHGGAGNHDGIKTFSTNTAITETDILSQVQTCVAFNAGGSRLQEDCAEFQVISTFAECTYNSSVNSGKTVTVPATSGGTDDARDRDARLKVGMLVLGADVPSNTKNSKYF